MNIDDGSYFSLHILCVSHMIGSVLGIPSTNLANVSFNPFTSDVMKILSGGGRILATATPSL